MLTFFFDVEINGQRMIDDEGVALPDLQSAKREAITSLYAIANETEMDASSLHARMCVRNSIQEVLLVLEMTLTLSQPAPRH